MWIPRLFMNICCALAAWVRKCLAPTPKAIVSPPSSPDDAYIARRTAALLTSFASGRSQEAANANMCATFYSREALRTALVFSGQNTTTSAIEKRWAARVLVESTPRGNLFMHYDVYKGAFAYYCDASLPYALVNAAAMRYVAVFACRDLFVDDAVLGAERRSPLAALEEADEGLDLSRKIGALKTQSAPGMGPLPFAKLKKYAAMSATGDPPASEKAGSAQVASASPRRSLEPAMNRFVYLGRTRDMQLHQKSNISETMTETTAACWRAKAAEIADRMKTSKKDSVGYAEYALKKRLVEKKLAETRVCETAQSRLDAHFKQPHEGVSDHFIDTYLTIQGCTGNESRPSRNFADTPLRREEGCLFGDAENIWQSNAARR